MADTFHCKECDKTLRCSCQSMECAFDYSISDHMRAHGCTCDIDSNGNRARCAHCIWFDK